jgi:hypothetical protein
MVNHFQGLISRSQSHTGHVRKLLPAALGLWPLLAALAPLGPFNFFDHDALTERLHSSSSQAGQEENDLPFYIFVARWTLGY